MEQFEIGNGGIIEREKGSVQFQILLAGVIAPLPDHSVSKFLANSFITARWGQRALEALLPSDAGIDRAEYSPQIAMVAIHMAVFAAATLLVLWRRT